MFSYKGCTLRGGIGSTTKVGFFFSFSSAKASLEIYELDHLMNFIHARPLIQYKIQSPIINTMSCSQYIQTHLGGLQGSSCGVDQTSPQEEHC